MRVGEREEGRREKEGRRWGERGGEGKREGGRWGERGREGRGKERERGREREKMQQQDVAKVKGMNAKVYPLSQTIKISLDMDFKEEEILGPVANLASTLQS